MFKIVFIMVLTSLMLSSGCASFSYESRPFFSSKFDCGNGWRAMNQTLCDFELRGY